MIRVLLDGRFGNHLFQVAAALALAHARGTELVVDASQIPGVRGDLAVRSLPIFRFSFPRRIGSVWLDRLNRALRGRPTHELIAADRYEERGHDYDPAFAALGKNVVLKGYFQNARYFEHAAPQIRRWFDPTPWFACAPEDYRTAVAEEDSVGVHVRRTDYLHPKHTHFQVCGPAYFERAMARMRSARPQCRFVIFSDDIGWCREHFRNSRCTVIDTRHHPHTALVDFALLSACQHQIISNSSYAWWAAWLNSNPERIVLSPDRWTTDGRIPLESKRIRGMETVTCAPA